jgi:hypothetical protein
MLIRPCYKPTLAISLALNRPLQTPHIGQSIPGCAEYAECAENQDAPNTFGADLICIKSALSVLEFDPPIGTRYTTILDSPYPWGPWHYMKLISAFEQETSM